MFPMLGRAGSQSHLCHHRHSTQEQNRTFQHARGKKCMPLFCEILKSTLPRYAAIHKLWLLGYWFIDKIWIGCIKIHVQVFKLLHYDYGYEQLLLGFKKANC